MKTDKNLLLSAADLSIGYAILTINFKFHNTSVLLSFIIGFVIYIQCFIGFLFLLKGAKNAILFLTNETK